MLLIEIDDGIWMMLAREIIVGIDIIKCSLLTDEI